MMKWEKFFQKFSRYFPQYKLRSFYESIPSMFAYAMLKKQGQSKLFELEEKYQWPILRSLDRPDLPIFRDAENAETVQKFINIICKEKELRRKGGTWEDFSSVIRERLMLYTYIFGINKKDIRNFKELSEKNADKIFEEKKAKKESDQAYVELLKKAKRKKLLKKVAAITGAAAAVVGTGLAGKAVYSHIKNKKEK